MLYLLFLALVGIFCAIWALILCTAFFVIIVDILWSWLRTRAYYRVEMVGSSTRGQLRSVLDKILGNLFRSYDPDDQDTRISVIDRRKFSAIVSTYERILFWRVKHRETTFELPGIFNSFARSSSPTEDVLAKPSVLIIVDNAARLSDRHLSDLIKVNHWEQR